MGTNIQSLSQFLAHNLIDLRKRRGLTQEELAKLVDLPRSTIANLESGTGNPSLQSLANLSTALQTSIDKLLSPQRTSSLLIRASDTPVQERAQGHVKVFKLLPDNLPSMEIDRLDIEAGYNFKGIPHPPGTKEYFHCTQGEFVIKISDEEFILKKGDTLAFPGQVAHTYFNRGKTMASGLSVVALAPLTI